MSTRARSARRSRPLVVMGSATALLALAACGSSLTSSNDVVREADASTSRDGAATSPFSDAGSAPIEANAIVLVHAAAFPAFRICFDGTLNERPLPTTDLMPESNVVGVDVGTAVRLPARSGVLGRAFVFPEADLRPLYPAFGGEAAGPTCAQVINGATKSSAVTLNAITDDLARGVHALVLLGCRRASLDPMASVDRCGSSWDPTSGNLELRSVPLTAYAKPRQDRLAVQLVQLSPALQRRAQGRALGIAFGAIEAGVASPPFIEGAVPFGAAIPNPPAALDLLAGDPGSYATNGLFVTLVATLTDGGAPLDAGGPREVLVAQSLADVQRRSSSRALPSDWFAATSSYVVLSVGDPAPRLIDGGVDDDPRRGLHLLAVPLATPDAGDAGN